jgi:hypothetical protein
MHLSDRSPATKTGAAIVATAILLVAILLARLILTQGRPGILGQDVDLPAAGLVLASVVFGLWMTRQPRSISIPDATNRRLLVAAFVVFGLLAMATLVVFGTSPAAPDEQAALFQARLFSEFKVIGQYPTGLVNHMLLPAYQNTIILVGDDGRAMSVYWPGWALLMTPFVWLGVPWLLGPTMGGLGAFLIGKLAMQLHGAQAGTVAVLLTVTSGAFVLNAMSLYPAGGHLTLSLLYAWLVLRGKTRDYVLAGLVGSLALVLNNPYPHAVFALPWVLWLLKDSGRRRRLIPLAFGYVPGLVTLAGWVLLQNTLKTHDSTAAAHVWLGQLSLLVTIPNVTNMGDRLEELTRVWAWAAPGLLVLAGVGWWLGREQIGLRLLGASFVGTVLLYALFPGGQGLGYGARYYHVAWGALPILAAVPLVTIGWERLRNFALASAVVGLVLVVPLEMAYAHGLATTAGVPMSQLRVPGADLCFVDFDQVAAPGMTMNNNPSTQGFLVLISQGRQADQALVDRYFAGSRLVSQTSFGTCYARP